MQRNKHKHSIDEVDDEDGTKITEKPKKHPEHKGKDIDTQRNRIHQCRQSTHKITWKLII